MRRGSSAGRRVSVGGVGVCGEDCRYRLDPVTIMTEAVKVVSSHKGMELLWASPRELLNIFQANDLGCHIITATNSVLSKLKVVGKDLGQYSLETVQMFYNDAAHSGYKL